LPRLALRPISAAPPGEPLRGSHRSRAPLVIQVELGLLGRCQRRSGRRDDVLREHGSGHACSHEGHEGRNQEPLHITSPPAATKALGSHSAVTMPWAFGSLRLFSSQEYSVMPSDPTLL